MLLLVLCSFSQLSVCVANQTSRIVPLRARINFPKTHERIIVPVEPINREEKLKVDKPVSEHPVESNVRRKVNKTKYSVETESPVRIRQAKRNLEKTETPVRSRQAKRNPDQSEAPVRSRQAKRNPEIYDDGKGNYRNSNSYASRFDNHQSHEDANQIQPLHIDTKVFKKKRPQEGENIKPTQEDPQSIKLEDLPQNPTEIPATSWFDNTGKYYYGIVHDETFTEPPEYSGKQETVSASLERSEELPQQKVFKSSFRDPKYVEPLIYNDGLGNFLYKSEIHYPSYRNLLYAPVVTYPVHSHQKPAASKRPATKEIPTKSVLRRPSQVTRPTKEAPESRAQPDEEARQEPKKQEAQEQAQEESEDYEEDSSEDDEDGASNDRYDGEAPGDGK